MIVDKDNDCGYWNDHFWMRLKNLLFSLIIGSGAFNLLVISAIRCRPPRLLKSWNLRHFSLSTEPPISVFVIPEDETRRVKTYAVFLVTMFWSIFAFIWLFIIIAISSRDKVILLCFLWARQQMWPQRWRFGRQAQLWRSFLSWSWPGMTVV